MWRGRSPTKSAYQDWRLSYGLPLSRVVCFVSVLCVLLSLAMTGSLGTARAMDTGSTCLYGAGVRGDDLVHSIQLSQSVIDTSTGLLITQKAKSHIAGNLGVTVPGMNMVIPMDINGITTVDAL